MDRFEELQELFRDFCADENKGDEDLVAAYERQIITARNAARNRTIYSA